jgi:hypothetical protein
MDAGRAQYHKELVSELVRWEARVLAAVSKEASAHAEHGRRASEHMADSVRPAAGCLPACLPRAALVPCAHRARAHALPIWKVRAVLGALRSHDDELAATDARLRAAEAAQRTMHAQLLWTQRSVAAAGAAAVGIASIVLMRNRRAGRR